MCVCAYICEGVTLSKGKSAPAPAAKGRSSSRDNEGVLPLPHSAHLLAIILCKGLYTVKKYIINLCPQLLKAHAFKLDI